MRPITFSIEDLRTADRLERVLQQFKTAVETPIIQAPTKFSPAAIDTQALAEQVAKLVAPELQATGAAPLNVSNLLPGGAAGGIAIVGTHSDRLSLYPATKYPAGQLYYEIDRSVFYIVRNFGGGALTWTYASGMLSGPRASHPADLGSADVGFLFNVSDYVHLVRWDGVAWELVDAIGGYFLDSAITRGAGYQLCDGTVTDYLLDATTNLAVQPFTTPDETSGLSVGTFHKSAAAYTGVVLGPVVPVITGSTAIALSLTSLNVVPDNVPNAGPDTVMDVTTTISDPGHVHGVGTLVVGNNGAPISMGVLRYFRR
jgi:hypothetical protein